MLPKYTRNNYHVIPVVVSFNLKGKQQFRYMQCVTGSAKEELTGVAIGDKVIVNIALKGLKKSDKCLNLDEIISIAKI